MRVPEKRSDDEGLLSLDFIVGFSIFMIGLIFVGIMVSGLLVQLQSRTVDYDAVAYRTSVILVEDPGWALVSNNETTTSWELNDISNPQERAEIFRLGLSIGKNYEPVLNIHKIDRFFHSGFSNEEYRNKLVFGDYPYNFNISLKALNASNLNYSCGDPAPNSSYGYIKRLTKIKIQNNSILTLNVSGGNISSLNVELDLPMLYNREIPYRIDPLREGIQINVRNFTAQSYTTNLTGMQFSYFDDLGNPTSIYLTPDDYSTSVKVYHDGLPDSPPTSVINDNLTIVIEPQFFSGKDYIDEFDKIQFFLDFDDFVTNESSFSYDYNTIEPLPDLIPAVLEVKIW